MTIGIGAAGPRAGEAVYRALQKAERIGENSIGGFAVYAAIRRNNKVVYYETQRGGTTTLVTKGEVTGVSLPPEVLEARVAGVISSGPDRKIDPLRRLLPAVGETGLVTGHRIPLADCRVHGEAMNLECLKLMQKGISPKNAVDEVIGDNLEADVGLIGVSVRGEVHLRNSDRVSRRNDMVEIKKEDGKKGVEVAVLMNEIFPVPATAEVAAETAFDLMTERWKPDGEIFLRTGLKLENGSQDEVHVDEDRVATRIVISDDFLLRGEQFCVVPYIRTKVFQNGNLIGYTAAEFLSLIRDGVLEDLSGQKELSMAVRGE